MAKTTPGTPQRRVDSDSTIAARMRAERRANRGKSNPADWSSIDPSVIVELVCAVSNAGALLTLGYSRDMGAYMVGIFDGGERTTDYCRPSEDVEAFLRGIVDDFTSA